MRGSTHRARRNKQQARCHRVWLTRWRDNNMRHLEQCCGAAGVAALISVVAARRGGSKARRQASAGAAAPLAAGARRIT